MIKGKAKIELFDAKTGKLEKSVEEHNLVTNALRYLINIAAICNAAPDDYVFPIATKALGGIMLFDGNLTEDKNNVHFPPVDKGVHLVGYASNDTNTSDINRGSFNSAESGPTDNGYKSVWDFGTSQANGTIKAVARTHVYAGQDPLRYYVGLYNNTVGSGNPSNDTYWHPFRYDGEYVYMMKNQDHTMRIYKVRRPMLAHKVADSAYRNTDFEQVGSFDTLAAEGEYNDYGETRSIKYYADRPALYKDGGDGYLYCAYAGYNPNYEAGMVINYFTVKYSDDSYEKSNLHEIILQAKMVCESDGYYDRVENDGKYTYVYRYGNYIDDSSEVRISHGYLYLISSGRKRILQINLSNTTDQSSIRIIEDNSSDYIYDLQGISLRNGGAFFTVYHYTNDSRYYQNGVLYEDGSYLLHSFSGNNNENDWCNSIRVNGKELERFGYYNDVRIQRGFIANYLGTIANLTSPIEKNASQTMKITYELIDADDTTEG